MMMTENEMPVDTSIISGGSMFGFCLNSPYFIQNYKAYLCAGVYACAVCMVCVCVYECTSRVYLHSMSYGRNRVSQAYKAGV